jgi:hypothetical protein
MANIAIPFAAVPQAQVPSAGFNANFTEVAAKFNAFAVQTDVAKIITVTHTWNASQTFAAGMLLQGDLLFTDATVDIGKVGATRPRDGFFSRNLTVGTGITVSDPAGKVTVGGTSGAFVLGTPAQGQLAASGGDTYLDYGGTLHIRQGAATEVAAFNSIGNQLLLGTGINLKFGVATSKIIGGATSHSIRNNADTFDNLLITDAGIVTARNSFNTAAASMSNGSPFVSGFNLVPLASDPSTPNNGDLWITTAGAMKARLNGAVRTFLYQNPGSGYSAFTNTINRATVYDTTTVTLAQLAARVAAIQADLTSQVILSA